MTAPGRLASAADSGGDNAGMTDAKRLDESLDQLRSEIEALDSHDDEARQRLGRLLHDIEQVRQSPKRSGVSSHRSRKRTPRPRAASAAPVSGSRSPSSS